MDRKNAPAHQTARRRRYSGRSQKLKQMATLKKILLMAPALILLGLATPALAQKTTSNTSDEKPKGVFSVFKKSDEKAGSSTSDNDVKARHQDAKKDVLVAKRERKAAEAKEEAARARAEAIKAEKRASAAENKSQKADVRADKTRQKVGGGR